MPKQKQHLKQRKDGRYACRYKNQWFMGATEDEALQAREDYKFRERLGVTPEIKESTVKDYSILWVNVYKKGKVSKRTFDSYCGMFDKMNSVIGKMKMQLVTASDVQRMWSAFDGYCQSYIGCARGLFSSMWDTAIEDGYCQRNPIKSKHVTPPKGTSGTHRSITPEERQQIHATQSRLRPAVMVMLYAGLRRGEVMALNVDEDIDFEHKVIHVTKAISQSEGDVQMSTTKTEAGVRDVPLLDVLIPELEGLHGNLVTSIANNKRADGVLSVSGFVNMWEHYLRQVEEQTGKPFHIRPHDLRHSFCTMLRDAGVDIKVAMRWMGHADEKMILHIYDHITDLRISQSIERLEALVNSQLR